MLGKTIGVSQITQPRVQQHVVTVRRGPVGKRHSRSQRGHQCPDPNGQQRNNTRCCGKSVDDRINLFR